MGKKMKMEQKKENYEGIIYLSLWYKPIASFDKYIFLSDLRILSFKYPKGKPIINE